MLEGTLFHEGSLMHEDVSARKVTFAQIENLVSFTSFPGYKIFFI